MDEEIVLSHLVHHVAVVDGEIFESRIGGLDDDLGVEAGAPQGALNAYHRVADGVAIAQRGEDLVHPRRAAHESPGPVRTAETTFLPGRSVFCRLAHQPGIASNAGTGSRFSRSSMSRYFRSITGHV